jgi:hypothetical protein
MIEVIVRETEEVEIDGKRIQKIKEERIRSFKSHCNFEMATEKVRNAFSQCSFISACLEAGIIAE